MAGWFDALLKLVQSGGASIQIQARTLPPHGKFAAWKIRSCGKLAGRICLARLVQNHAFDHAVDYQHVFDEALKFGREHYVLPHATAF
ncbi:hypothetical protein MFFC18_24790 [Mariniblastus fucicola]|uniref:Uncharacterized protein n=1 Tax=Mariniblastus fucicola TaxID=980251 RepID=A0A5B9PDE9_9BACT|nr:hypothetical protein MFFC18_24790 [Mariniblastus fucicola]